MAFRPGLAEKQRTPRAPAARSVHSKCIYRQMIGAGCLLVRRGRGPIIIAISPRALEMQGKRILLGVTGGIAAYKSADLVRRLRDRGAEVQVVMTQAAAEFITATTRASENTVSRTWPPSKATVFYLEKSCYGDLAIQEARQPMGTVFLVKNNLLFQLPGVSGDVSLL